MHDMYIHNVCTECIEWAVNASFSNDVCMYVYMSIIDM